MKVEDPLFAEELSIRLSKDESGLTAVPVPVDTKRTNCRKVYISWHKSTKSVWLNFGNGDIASRVAQKFNEGKYKCLGQAVTSSARKTSLSHGRRGGGASNPVAWTIILGNVPGCAARKDVEAAIFSAHDKPRHIEMGAASYETSDAEVSIGIRSLLEKHGYIESFFLASASKGKRAKATAWFRDEADARSACTLNNEPLRSLGGGKLTVTLVQSAKVKVPMPVYEASRNMLEDARKTWAQQHLAFRIYPDASQRFTTLKVEGDNAKDVANARRTLNEISSGATLTDGVSAIWSPALNSNGSAYRTLKSIERDLHVVIFRDKSRRQLQFHGPPDQYQEAAHRVADMLKMGSSKSYEIALKPDQFARMIRGGFKDVEQALGSDVAVFNVVSRTLTVNGGAIQYNTILEIIDGIYAPQERYIANNTAGVEKDCPICFCEAETPLQTSCGHTYCLECFEGYCKSAASTSKEEFRVECQGDGGDCPVVFNLRELKDCLSSFAFEGVLRSSFEEYIQRHTEAFRYCPTPDCGFIYRCAQSPNSSSKSLTYTCPNCFEPICTSCHARHGHYSCAEYKEIASGGREALEKLKQKLSIKDCPKCTTPMEKTEGCNHMVCAGCKTHICWVCMATFRTSDPCYSHMMREHGGIGLGLERFMY